MKRRTVVWSLLGGVALVLGLGSSRLVLAQADVIHRRIQVDLAGSPIIDCFDRELGERVIFVVTSGGCSGSFGVVRDAKGGYHSETNVECHGAAQDLAGNRYVFNNPQNQIFTDPPTPGQEQTLTSHFTLIGQGKLPDRSCRAVFHITFNANGDLTVFVDRTDLDCCELEVP